MPELGFGRLVSSILLQLLPPSVERLATIRFWRERQRIWSEPSRQVRIDGWIAPISMPSFATSTTGDHPFPPSRESQIPTSGFLSPVPPNQAATNPPRDSARVEA